jgi:dUTPase
MQVNVLTGRLTKSTEGSVGYDLYATEDVLLRAHLHLSVKINGISIDPEKFMKFFDMI